MDQRGVHRDTPPCGYNSMVECLPSKQDVEGSNPSARSTKKLNACNTVLRLYSSVTYTVKTVTVKTVPKLAFGSSRNDYKLIPELAFAQYT